MLTQCLLPLLPQADALHIRLPVLCHGEQEALLQQTRELLEALAAPTTYWIGEDAPPNTTVISSIRHQPLLGSECDVLVINAFNQFPAELIAASAGCVKAGGLWLVLCPPAAEFARQPNLAHKKLLSWPTTAESHQGYFQSFWLNQAKDCNVMIIDEQGIRQPLHWPTSAQSPSLKEQCLAVNAITQVATGHRKRPLILTADRGRGKSAALGIAAAQLAQAGKKHLLITTPSPDTAAIALQHFRQNTPAPLQQGLQFIPPDQLIKTHPAADLILIDEAAAIPTPVLKKIVQLYNRLVFSTTEHGYEGTGRGFQLRFKQYLQQTMPEFRQLHLQQPIRYAENDPLEQLIFRSFLLHQSLPDTTFQLEKAVTLQHYSMQQWRQQPQKLQSVFTLLSYAHYQTQISDLISLLDNPALHVFTLEQHGNIIACALISYEGRLPDDLTRQIYYGERRVQGHLLAQSLAFHLAQPQLATRPLARVMRIAVHPTCQQQGQGSRLLELITQQLQQDGVHYLGTSFGLTTELLAFWQKNQFSAIRLGNRADKASGEYSILMLKALLPTELVSTLAQQFAYDLFIQLASDYPVLSAELALALASPIQSPELSETEQQQLLLFSVNQRPLELIYPILYNWFNQYYTSIPVPQAALFCALLWQKKTWHEMAFMFNLDGKAAVIKELQQTVRMIDHTLVQTNTAILIAK